MDRGRSGLMIGQMISAATASRLGKVIPNCERRLGNSTKNLAREASLQLRAMSRIRMERSNPKRVKPKISDGSRSGYGRCWSSLLVTTVASGLPQPDEIVRTKVDISRMPRSVPILSVWTPMDRKGRSDVMTRHDVITPTDAHDEEPWDSRKRTISAPDGHGNLGTNQIFQIYVQLTKRTRRVQSCRGFVQAKCFQVTFRVAAGGAAVHGGIRA